ncbi:hypothetical protein EYB53_021080 [Candidatus Chloroploca sp. M-50]|uniref:Uncharacterized protein n=1 Tax=Candidatus Chloroploca mongolica TaxID=2528176 RepID=A0ABS4DFK5_9CHLR|nr:hypothetical protein [Candidatus Chloroploca mongolica]MBP1468218.1 hypothetical protein [Candidatus Chloroploca mongolica]
MSSITLRTQLIINGATVFLVVLLVLASQTLAGPTVSLPQTGTSASTITYQGRLSDANGSPLTATLPMTFKLYDAQQTLLWTEVRTGANAVPVTNGLFTVALGSVTPLETTTISQAVWLGLSVDGDPEMTPREKLGSVPSAHTVADGAITNSKLAAGAVTSDKLATGAVTSDKVSLNSGRKCVNGPVELTPPGNWQLLDVPELELAFSLNEAAHVLVWLDGIVLANDGASVGLFNVFTYVNGTHVMASIHLTDTDTWVNLAEQRLLNLEAGSHTIQVKVNSEHPGTIVFHEGWDGGVYQTCVNYLVF